MRAAIALLLAIALGGCGAGTVTPEAPVPTAPPPAAASPTASGASAFPTETPGATSTQPGDIWPSALRWSEPTYLPPGNRAMDAVAWSGGYVAVGSAADGEQTAAAAWVTDDWMSWERTLLDRPVEGGSTIARVIVVGSRLVAIGTSGVLRCVPPEGDGRKCDPLPIAFWSSRDGRNWQREPDVPALSGVYMTGIATNWSSAVMIGNRGWDRPGIWRSADGLAWDEESLPAAVFHGDGKFTGAHFLDVGIGPIGWIIVGFEGGTEPRCCEGNLANKIPAAWFSSDGWSWRRAAVVNAVDDAGFMLQRFFVGARGYVAYSGPGPERWVSEDGRTWSKANASIDTPSPWASDGTMIVGRSSDPDERLHISTSANGVADWRTLVDTGAVDEAPTWGATRVAANAAFLFPSGIGLLGENGTDRYPMWFARLLAGSSDEP